MNDNNHQAVYQLERAVREAISAGLEPHEVTEIAGSLAALYEQYDDPSMIAREDLASIYN